MNNEPCTIDSCPYHNLLFNYNCELDKSADCGQLKDKRWKDKKVWEYTANDES